MTSIPFDTLKVAREFREAGFNDRQAEAITMQIAKLVDDQLVTKQYLDLRLAELKNEMIRWIFGMLVVQFGFILTAIKFMH